MVKNILKNIFLKAFLVTLGCSAYPSYAMWGDDLENESNQKSALRQVAPAAAAASADATEEESFDLMACLAATSALGEIINSAVLKMNSGSDASLFEISNTLDQRIAKQKSQSVQIQRAIAVKEKEISDLMQARSTLRLARSSMKKVLQDLPVLNAGWDKVEARVLSVIDDKQQTLDMLQKCYAVTEELLASRTIPLFRAYCGQAAAEDALKARTQSVRALLASFTASPNAENRELLAIATQELARANRAFEDTTFFTLHAAVMSTRKK